MVWLAVLAGTTMRPTAFSVFIQPMGDDLGWSRTLLSRALSAGTLVGALAAPVAGAFAAILTVSALLVLLARPPQRVRG